MNIAIILSGGSGSRFDSELPKQYHLLRGRPVWTYALDAVRRSGLFDDIIFVGDDGQIDEGQFGALPRVAPSGASRNESLGNALELIQRSSPACRSVTVLEAARPFVTPRVLEDHLGFLEQHDAVVTAREITDSLSHRDGQFADRSDFLLIQAPESYRYDALMSCFSERSGATAPVHQLPPTARIHFYLGMPVNLKITYRQDLEMAEFLMQQRHGNTC